MVPVLPLDADLLDVAFGFVERGSEGSALMSTTGRVSSLEHCGTRGRVIEWGFLIDGFQCFSATSGWACPFSGPPLD